MRLKEQSEQQLHQGQESQRAGLQATIDQQKLEINQLTSQLSLADSSIKSLKGQLTRYQDVEDMRRMHKEHETQMFAAKEALQDDLETASAYILRMQEDHYEAKRTSLALLTRLKELEMDVLSYQSEIETLRSYIIDLKSRIAVYIPVKGDTVDKRIAEYINNYPDRQKLKIMFMRESEGVY